MKIYVLTHYWDNGESYEDAQDYQQSYYFDSEENMNSSWLTSIYDKQHGCWEAKSIELNTQITKKLWETEYLKCPSYQDMCEELQSDYEEQQDEKLRYNEDYTQALIEVQQQEDKDAIEWLNTNDSNVKHLLAEWKLIDKDLFDKGLSSENPLCLEVRNKVRELEDAYNAIHGLLF